VVETILLVLWALVFLLRFGYVKMATLLGADGVMITETVTIVCPLLVVKTGSDLRRAKILEPFHCDHYKRS
jgi:hypothetical protein